MNENNILGIILAGGKSSRFGEDKSFAKLGDKTLLDHTIDKIEKEFTEILVISNNKEFNFKNNKIHLAKKEFKLLYYLMTIPGKVFLREDIITNIWGETHVGDRTLDVHIRKIREKIGENYIKTVKGVDYKFDI